MLDNKLSENRIQATKLWRRNSSLPVAHLAVRRHYAPLVMQTLHQDIDDLDRMVTSGAPQDAVRSQIRLIAREVAVLEADYARSEQSHAQEMAEREQAYRNEMSAFKTANQKIVSENASLRAELKRRDDDYGIPPVENLI